MGVLEWILTLQTNMWFVHITYLHKIQMLFPNCYLTSTGRTAILASLGVFCGLVGLWGLTVLPKTRGIPKTMTALAILSSVFEVAHFISLGAEGKPGIASLIFLGGVDIIGGCISPFVFLWSFVSPALDLMMLHLERKMVLFRMKFLIGVYTIEQIGVFGTALGFQYQGNYKTFNIIYAWQLAVIAVYALLWAVAIKYYSSHLFKQMDAILGSDPDSKSSRIHRHRRKLGMYVI